MNKFFPKIKFLGMACVLACAFLYTGYVDAAYLYLVPSSGEVNVGDNFTILVKTDTQGMDVNVAEAKVNFPPGFLAVDRVNPGNTFKLQTPGSLNKTQNEIFFSAGIPSPGYNGASGVLGSITFRALASGTATISISDGKLLLNDGNASDALNNKIGSVIKIKPAPKAEDKQALDKQEVIVTYTKQEVEPDDQSQSNSIIIDPDLNPPIPSDKITLKFTLQDFIYTVSISITIIILLVVSIVYLSVRVIYLRRKIVELEKPKL